MAKDAVDSIPGRRRPKAPLMAGSQLPRRVFPFSLAGQSRSSATREGLRCPTREGVGLVEAHMAHRFVGRQRPKPGQRPDRPLPVVPFPIKRRLPPFLLHSRPAIIEPEQLLAVAAVGNKLLVLGISHEAVLQ